VGGRDLLAPHAEASEPDEPALDHDDDTGEWFAPDDYELVGGDPQCVTPEQFHAAVDQAADAILAEGGLLFPEPPPELLAPLPQSPPQPSAEQVATEAGSTRSSTCSTSPTTTARSLRCAPRKCGGDGRARPTKGGNNVDWPLLANAKNESMEVWEARYPVRFERYEIICDSGGVGRYRGGTGASRQSRMLAPVLITGCADRHVLTPLGLDGGGSGAPSRFSVHRNGEEYDLPTLFGISSPSKFSLLPLSEGDILDVSTGGGAGFGDPSTRDPSSVEQDILNGYITPENEPERVTRATAARATEDG